MNLLDCETCKTGHFCMFHGQPDIAGWYEEMKAKGISLAGAAEMLGWSEYRLRKTLGLPMPQGVIQ